ncbi:VOC family protein [Georgenia wangjunii]|uniref:VOC family protein n=1 Tax=Georgenia wangjunii TaxID=3117730 RepID=UPI002F26D33C
MDISGVTVGLPVSDLAAATEWYGRVFGLGAPELAPADGVVEFQLGPVWLQLGEEEQATRSGAAVVVRFEVADATAEHARLAGLGIDVDDVVHVPGAVDYVDFRDPDGNGLSVYSLAG